MLLVDLFLLRRSPYQHACEDSKAHLWAPFFLMATGAVYGFLLAFFQRTVGDEIGRIPLEKFPDSSLFGYYMIAGILVVLVFHGGVTLVVWLMARAVGGPGKLGDLYRATAYLMPLTAPTLPLLAARSVTKAPDISGLPWHGVYTISAWLGVLLTLSGLYQLFLATQGIQARRAGLAVALVALFCYSILHLVS